MERARGIIAASLLAAGLTFLAPGIGTAQAAPVVGCEHREPGHVERHGGQLVDDEYHRSRGESVTCDESPNTDQTRDDDRSTSTGDDDDQGSDRKSRYCRSRWYC